MKKSCFFRFFGVLTPDGLRPAKTPFLPLFWPFLGLFWRFWRVLRPSQKNRFWTPKIMISTKFYQLMCVLAAVMYSLCADSKNICLLWRVFDPLCETQRSPRASKINILVLFLLKQRFKDLIVRYRPRAASGPQKRAEKPRALIK